MTILLNDKNSNVVKFGWIQGVLVSLKINLLNSVGPTLVNQVVHVLLLNFPQSSKARVAQSIRKSRISF